MCVSVRGGAMGCGKSKHHSMEDSDIDIKGNKNGNNSNSNNSSNNITGNNSNNSKNGSSSSSNSTNGSNATGSGGKRKKQVAGDSKTANKENEKEEKSSSSPFKMLSNGKTSNRAGSGRSEEVGVPAGLSASGKTGGSGGGADKANGSLPPAKTYALEIPDEIKKQDPQHKTTCRDFKSLTSSKTVHVTNSQIEFFKMLDEKIDKGDEYTTSADVSEVSSVDDNFRH